MMSVDSCYTYRVAIVENSHLTKSTDTFDWITLGISVVAILVSIYAIWKAKRDEDSRKIKDFIISQLDIINNDLSTLLTEISSSSNSKNCQDVISNFKRIMMNLNGLSSSIESHLSFPKSFRKDGLAQSIQSLRLYITEANGFTSAYNQESFTLSREEINQMETLHTEIYKELMHYIFVINDCKMNSHKVNSKYSGF